EIDDDGYMPREKQALRTGSKAEIVVTARRRSSSERDRSNARNEVQHCHGCHLRQPGNRERSPSSTLEELEARARMNLLQALEVVRAKLMQMVENFGCVAKLVGVCLIG